MTVLGSLQRFRSAIRSKFGSETSLWHQLITTSQFHIMFYASRPLPNIFALAIFLNAIAFWLKDQRGRFILTSAFVILVFRGELALLLGTILIMDFIVGRAKIMHTLGYGLLGLILSLALTIGIDSICWQKFWLWPEGSVLYYNIVLNKSSDWGTSPWPWYFYSVLPRALFTSTFFIPIGIYFDRRTSLLIIPSLIFVLLFSFLPHKELRFIVYVFPMLNVAAAEACKRFWEMGKLKPSFISRFLAFAAVSHVILNSLFSVMMLYISSNNYPGGHAILEFHQMVPPNKNVKLHIDVYSAQTGVSRFLHLNENWTYDKSENLPLEELKKFQFLLMESSKVQNFTEKSDKSHQILKEISAFKGLDFSNWKTFPPVKCKLLPAVTILKKNKKK